MTSHHPGDDQSSSRGMPTAALFAAKLHPPPRRPPHVDLDRLLARLQAHRGVVLIVAPPGFGKTTLLARWQELDERPFGWLSMDSRDNDPVVCWTYIMLATRELDEESASGDEGERRVRGGDVTRTVVPYILDRLEGLEREVVLVLDDVHSISDPAVIGSLRLLLERQPPNVTIALSARADPALALGRLRVRPDLLELRAADLSFTLPETQLFLNGMLGLDLTEEAVKTLWIRTEGWPAGLYLAYLSLLDTRDREAFVSDFRGSSRHVVDYLTGVVVDAQDEPTREFLLTTSILDRMSGPLCDAVVGIEGSGEILARLEHANLFLIPLDDRREWYRYHRLFRELLRDELHRRQPRRLPDLHLRASRWFAEAGHAGDAIHHALAGGDVETGAALLSENYLRTLEWGGLATIARWLSEFPRKAVVSDVRLSVVEAWVMSFQNRYHEADLAMENAIRGGYDGPLPDGASSVEVSASLLRASSPRGDVGEMLRAARTAFGFEGDRQSMWQVTTHVQLGWALYLSGRSSEGRPLLERAAVQAPMSEQWLNAAGARTVLAWMAIDENRLDDAERLLMEANELVREHALAEPIVGDWIDATLGVVRTRQGRVDEAHRLLVSAVDRMRSNAPPLMFAQALLELVRIRREVGSPGDARLLLDEARAVIDECSDPGIVRAHLERAAKGVMPVHHQVVRERALTEREREVLRLFEKGMSKREIAQQLYLSLNTIHSHTKSIYRKLGVFSRDDAIARAREVGIL